MKRSKTIKKSNMTKLKIKYLIPYLEYDLKVLFQNKLCTLTGINIRDDYIELELPFKSCGIHGVCLHHESLKMRHNSFIDYSNPILKPFDGNIDILKHSEVVELVKNHYDIYNLIPEGLAVEFTPELQQIELTL